MAPMSPEKAREDAKKWCHLASERLFDKPCRTCKALGVLCYVLKVHKDNPGEPPCARCRSQGIGAAKCDAGDEEDSDIEAVPSSE